MQLFPTRSIISIISFKISILLLKHETKCDTVLHSNNCLKLQITDKSPEKTSGKKIRLSDSKGQSKSVPGDKENASPPGDVSAAAMENKSNAPSPKKPVKKRGVKKPLISRKRARKKVTQKGKNKEVGLAVCPISSASLGGTSNGNYFIVLLCGLRFAFTGTLWEIYFLY